MTKTIGIAGGGQLGRMLADAAHGGPAAQVADEEIVGDYRDRRMMQRLADKSDVVTFEVESVNADALIEIAKSGKPVHPTPHTLATIKDKLKQKEFLRARGIPVAPFERYDISYQSGIGKRLGYPFVLKARSGGFDGRGNALVENEASQASAREKLKGAPAYAEGFVRFDKELAVVAVRTVKGDIRVFPLVETVHRDHICHLVLCPALVTAPAAKKAQNLAERVLAAFDGAGVFAIEMFLVGEDVLVNEVAPRVHNSGHLTIEACETSQFEQHIRAVSGMELGSTDMKVAAACMINILGERDGKAEPKGVDEAEKIPGVKVHIYGKMETRRQRKMGHITAVGETLEEAREKAEKASALISI
jgi:phosphoribosylaminoimidazole carboxylase